MAISKLLGALSPQEVIKKVNEIIDNMGSGSSFSGSYNDLTDKPTIPAAYTLPTASATQLGGVKVGSGLMVTDGVLVSDITKTSQLTNDSNFITSAQIWVQ